MSAALFFAVLCADALDADALGQNLEAVDEYERVAQMIGDEESLAEMQLSKQEAEALHSVQQRIFLRIQAISSLHDHVGDVQLHDVKEANGVIISLFSNLETAVPQQRNVQQKEKLQPQAPTNDSSNNNSSLPHRKTSVVVGVGELILAPSISSTTEKEVVRRAQDQSEEEKGALTMMEERKSGGTLLPCMQFKSGETGISVQLEKIGLKDALSYVAPFVTCSVVDNQGRVVGKTQDTPPANFRHCEVPYIHLNHTVYFQTPLEKLKTDWALFFEFKHYKHSKNMISTRCFAFVEYDEIVNSGSTTICLELYKKPTDFSRKKLILNSKVKPLYLHLKLMLSKN